MLQLATGLRKKKGKRDAMMIEKVIMQSCVPLNMWQMWVLEAVITNDQSHDLRAL